MKNNLFLFLFLFLSAEILSAQQKDTVYYIQLISESTTEEIPFANLIANSGTAKTGNWETDLDGIIRIKSQEINKRDPELIFTAQYVNFAETHFSVLQLIPNDTLVIRMKDGNFFMGDFEVVEYTVPLIDPEYPPTSGKKKKTKESAPEPVYSQEQLCAFDSLKNKTLFINDTLENKSGLQYSDWKKLFNEQLQFPLEDYHNNIQGKIYIDFTLDENGTIKDITLIKGASPAASLEVARLLNRMPPILPDQNYFYGTYSQIKSHPIRCRIAVNFILK